MIPAPEISVYCTITEWNVGSLRPFLNDMANLKLKRVGFIHNNFVTQTQADAHNQIYQGTFRATASNVFQSDLEKIDLPMLADELGEISRSAYPFAVAIQPSLVTLPELQ